MNITMHGQSVLILPKVYITGSSHMRYFSDMIRHIMIARFPTILILVLFAFLGPQACNSQTPIPEPVSLTTLTLNPEASGLRLTIETAAPVTQLTLEDYGQAQRRDGWTIIGDAHNFDGATLSRKDGATWSKVEFLISPETEFYNRRYFAVDRIGDAGWLFYKAIFALEDGPVNFRLSGFDAQMVRDGVSDVTGQNDFVIFPEDDTLLYVGPRENLRAANPDFIAGPEVPSWLRAQMARDMASASETLTRRLGDSGEYKPTLYVSYAQDERFKSQGWKGGAMKQGVIALRIRNMTLDENDAGLVDAFTGLIGHETTHMWIGQRLKNLQNEQQSWAHEGTTEYVSDRMRMSPDAFRIEAEETLNRCIAEQGKRPLDGSEGYVQGLPAYDCGFVVSLFAELGAVNQGKDILTIWADVIAARDNEYQPEDFLAAARAYNPNGFPNLAARLISGKEAARWTNISDDLAGLPITLEAAGQPSNSDLSLNNWWLGRLMPANCGGAISIYSNSDHKGMAGEGLCDGKWNANFDLVGVNGLNMFTAPRDVYDDVRARCAAGETLTFNLLDGTVLTDMPCGLTDIPAVPPYIRIVNLELPPL